MAFTLSLNVMMVMVVVQLTAGQGNFAGVSTSCTNGQCGSGVAQSHNTDASGRTTGTCAYINEQGQQVKIHYVKAPNGQISAEADPGQSYVQDPVAELRVCQEQADRVSHNVNQNILQTQDQIRQQTDQLQQNILRQQQALFNQHRLNFPPNFLPNFNFGYNFPQPVFGHGF